MAVAMGKDKDIDNAVNLCKSAGCTVDRNEDAGTVAATDPTGAPIFKAIRKGAKGQPWICRYIDSEFMKWK